MGFVPRTELKEYGYWELVARSQTGGLSVYLKYTQELS